MEDFKSISKFRIFNTNNLWVKMAAIEEVLKNDSLSMEVIENSKVCVGE